MSSDRFDLVADAASSWPKRTAIIDSSRSLTFEELHTVVTSRAAEIKSTHAVPDSKSSIIPVEGPASVGYITELLATLAAGRAAAPLNMRYPAVVRQMHRENLRTYTFEEPRLVVQTSGSSGNPKSALLSVAALVASAQGVNERLLFSHEDRWLCPLPLWHVGGLGVLFRCLIAGGTMIVADSASLKEMILTHSPTHISLVDAQWSRVLAETVVVTQLQQSCRAILLGGSSISSSRIRRGLELNLPVYLSYGLTEMSSTVAIKKIMPEDCTGEPLSSGSLLTHRQMRISADGIIEVNGLTRFSSFLEDDALSTPFDNDGWYSTGDRGRMNSAGELVVEGRIDSMFISGGENIQPETIERLLRADSRIDEAVVVPVQHELFGQRPVAILRLSENSKIQIVGPECEQKLRESLPGYMIPVAWLGWPPVSNEDAEHKFNRRELQSYAERLVSSN